MKKIIKIILSVILCLFISSCGKSEEAKKTDNIISSIGEVTLDSEAKINEAQTAVDSLDEKSKVSNISTLNNAKNQLSEIKKGCCFSIEGGWGIGKTFVIEEVSDRLKLQQSEETFDNQYFVFNYNCWKYDYYKEPLVAIISSMLESLEIDKKWFDKGIDKILKKVGEECTELVIAAKNPDPEEIKYEMSDFLYHAMVLMVERGVTWEDITEELANR